MPMSHVALFFGSFNPVHVGHLMLAQYVVNASIADEVWLVVSPQNPFKSREELAPAEHRLSMARLATEADAHIFVSDVEQDMPMPSYTIDTLRRLDDSYPHLSFSILMGADNLLGFDGWKDYEAILAKHRLIVYPRLGSDGLIEKAASLGGDILLTDAPIVEISSTQIRSWLTHGKSVRHFVPDVVADYLAEHRLY